MKWHMEFAPERKQCSWQGPSWDAGRGAAALAPSCCRPILRTLTQYSNNLIHCFMTLSTVTVTFDAAPVGVHAQGDSFSLQCLLHLTQFSNGLEDGFWLFFYIPLPTPSPLPGGILESLCPFVHLSLCLCVRFGLTVSSELLNCF